MCLLIGHKQTVKESQNNIEQVSSDHQGPTSTVIK